MKKNKIKKKLGGVHGIQSVSVLANIVPSVWPVWLNVMLACCVDSNLKKKKKLCQLCQLTFQRCASLFFLFVCVYACADTLRVHVCVCVCVCVCFFSSVCCTHEKK